MKFASRILFVAWVFTQFLCVKGAYANELGTAFAKVWRIDGLVTAESGQSAQIRTLKPGDIVFVGDRMRATASGEVVLRVEDGGYVAMRPGAEFLVEEFVANKSSSDRVSLKLLQGGLRLITGWVGKLNPKGYRVQTPSATIGIRGTDHEAYFLTSPMASSLSQTSGTYDKVLSGQTYLQTPDGSVDIEPGKVGFARSAQAPKTRALITLLLPVILDKVPEFFVPGQFDAELDQLSPMAAVEDILRTPDVDASTVSRQPIPVRSPSGSCNALGVAQAWLAQLDAAVSTRDVAGVLALFAQDARISAVVVDSVGQVKAFSLSRDEFAAGTLSALKALSGYSQRRLSVSAEPDNVDTCDTLSAKSLVIEQGMQNGKPYRFETVEEYQLKLVNGLWLATTASTKQQ